MKKYKDKKIVVIGGGTGLSTMLRDIKKYTHMEPHTKPMVVKSVYKKSLFILAASFFDIEQLTY